MRVLVAGGGVAGTVTAIALRRFGADVSVFESHPDPGGDVGSFVSLAVNGLRGLAAIDCLDRVRDRGFSVARQRMWTGSGRLLGDVPRGRLATDSLHGVTVMRAHLVGELRAAAREAGVEIVTGKRLVGATSSAAGVEARFADGTTTAGELLVGADGIWSATRRILAAAAPQPRYAGIYVVSGVSRDVGAVGDGMLDGGAFNLVFARGGAFVHLTTPGGDVWWQAQVTSPAEPDRTEDAGDAERLRRLREVYRDAPAPSAVLDAATTLHPTTLNHVLEPAATWHDGRVVLIGDAAHPVGAGQGAAMAVEDGLVLAAALRSTGLSAAAVPAALAGYDARRRPRITKLLKTAAENRDVKTAGPVRRKATELVMPFVFRHVYERATAWLYTYRIEGPDGAAGPHAGGAPRPARSGEDAARSGV